MPIIPPEEPDKQPEQAECLLGKDASLIQLGSDLWIDLEGGTIIRKQREILLTARELHVLRILVHAWRNGRQYISARAIADRIYLPDMHNPEHSVEQTVSLIRQKLGEIAHHPRILHGRRGFGYRLFPEIRQSSR